VEVAEVLGLNGAAGGEDQRRGEAFLQLADVARPAVGHEAARRVGVEGHPARLARQAFHQRGDDEPDVLAPRAQRRDAQGEPGEAGEEILAEAAARRQRLEVAVAGRDDAQVDGDRARLADGHDLALLQDAQECGLLAELEIADLVEEERALVGAAHQAGPVLAGVGIGAAPHAEELALDEGLGDGAAVHRHERAAAPAGSVDGARQDLLAGAGLALEDHRHGRPGDRLEVAELRAANCGFSVGKKASSAATRSTGSSVPVITPWR
jgi:hypothetical protein